MLESEFRTNNIALFRQVFSSTGFLISIDFGPSVTEPHLPSAVNETEIEDSLNKEIVLMHPGPINRGVELSSDAADSDHSIILDQVENGVAVRMAVLYLLASQND